MKYEHQVGLVWGIPTLFRPTTLQWALAFKAMNPPINYNVNFAIVPNERVDHARNIIAKQALDSKAKYIFFQDDDTVAPPHALRQLIFRMEQDPELGVVGGIYYTKSKPAFPLVFRGNGAGSYWDWKVGEYFEVSGIGMGCTLIRVEMLKSMEFPYFQTVDTDSFTEGVNHAEQWTEDLYFCKKVLENTTYKIYADGGILCEHHDAISQRAWGIESGTLPTRKMAVESNRPRILDIGCGPLVREDLSAEGELVRVDIREECNPDYRCDVRHLPFGNDSFDIVFSSHVLEHFGRNDSEPTLKEWIRVLKPGGEIRLVLPNIKWAADRIKEIDTNVLNVLYGAQDNPYDYHKAGFTPETLAYLMIKCGCSHTIRTEESGYNMKLMGIKL